MRQAENRERENFFGSSAFKRMRNTVVSGRFRTKQDANDDQLDDSDMSKWH